MNGWILVLLVLLLFCLWCHFRLWRRMHVLSRQVTERRQSLTSPGWHLPWEKPWLRLLGSINRLLTNLEQLDQQKSGQLAQLEATLGNLQEAVLIIDRDNYVLLANRALKRIFPRVTDILGRRLESLLRNAAFLEYLRFLREGFSGAQREIEFVESEGSVWLEVTGTVLPRTEKENGPWVLFVLHDITRLKKLERVRQEFVANVSHELKTPLSVIKGCAETLVDEEGMESGQRLKFLASIHRHAERLHLLVEDLLSLSRLESKDPGLRRRKLDLGRWLPEVGEELRLRWRAKDQERITFSFATEEFFAYIDPVKLGQVFDNLLDNALKYSPGNTGILVGSRPLPEGMEVWVQDHGPGIPAESLPHIFERFYRVDQGRSRERGGTGLGLSIVKHIIQLHGGRVWAESRSGQGTRIAFVLPEYRESLPVPAKATSLHAGENG